MERIPWEGQNFSEVVAPKEEEEGGKVAESRRYHPPQSGTKVKHG
jgi:hypothetical protein